MGPRLSLPPLDATLVPLEGAAFGFLPTPAEAVPQELPHADGTVADAELPLDQRGNALESPQLGRVARGTRAPQEQPPEAFLLDLCQPGRTAGNGTSA